MKQRSLIKSQIAHAWEECITKDYCNQRINSERSLQASLWSHINDLLPKTRRLFIEPCMTIKTRNGLKRLYPDIVICSTKAVISVIELKYLPRVQPKFRKDLESLSLIAKNRNQISIANERFRGKDKDSVKYPLSKDILFVWAGVHAEEEEETLYSVGYESLDGCYLQLHAATKSNLKPEIIRMS